MHAIYENVHKETPRPSSSDKPGKATWEERLQFSGIAASSSLLSCMLYTHHPPLQDDSSDKDKTIAQDKKQGRCRPKKQPAPLPTSSSEADSGGKAAAGRKMPLGRVVVDVAEMSGKPKWFELKPMRGCREPKGLELQLTCEVVLPPLLAGSGARGQDDVLGVAGGVRRGGPLLRRAATPCRRAADAE